MEELKKSGNLTRAAMLSNMDRKTARKYRETGQLPSETKQPRAWRTRPDPFESDWEGVVSMLEDAPELEAKTIFEHLQCQAPKRYSDGQLRTLQRKIRRYRAQHGVAKEVFFPQCHRRGELLQTDFTHASTLGITIGGQPFPHLLCNVVLPYSNWQCVTVARSESMAALRSGLQSALFRLGRTPKFHQTDNSTAATHKLSAGKRGFNQEYEELMKHFSLTPRTIQVGESHQNGDVEALNGSLKRRLEQHLLLRGHRDFESESDYVSWLESVVEQANRSREKKLAEELAVMKPVSVSRLPEHRVVRVPVRKTSTINVLKNIYSVPARLIGEEVEVHVYEARIEVFYAGRLELEAPKLRGEAKHAIDYRHVIDSLLRKPGAFERYRFREEMFPAVVFRRAYDALVQKKGERLGGIEYLRILDLAAKTMECEVETAIECLFDENAEMGSQQVKELVVLSAPTVPSLAAFTPNLSSYDELLSSEVCV